MSPALPSRRAAALSVAAAIGLSTAALCAPGVASADALDLPVFAIGVDTNVTVPATACAVDWVVTGAAGGDSASFDGGVGDRVTVTTSVTPGSTLLVQPGQRGSSDGTGGTSGDAPSGGSGGAGAAGGGGASIVRAGDSVSAPVLVLAAGGGGGGTGADGGAAGIDGGTFADATGGRGATVVAPGAGGGVPDGSPGTDGGNGTWLVGGSGPAGAGGGGGGLYGGGSGASDGTDGSGGGGGSSAMADQPTNPGYEDPDPTIDPATELEGSVRGTWVPCVAPYGPHGFSGDGTAGDGELSVVFFTGTNSAGHPRVAPVTGWEVSVDDGATWATPATTPVTVSEPGGSGGWPALRATVTGLTNGQSYAVRVRPTSAVGPGEEVDETLLLTPRAPVVVPDGGQVGVVTPPGPVGAPVAAPSSVPVADGPLTGPNSTTRGGTITLSGSGYLPGSTVSLYVYSTPRLLGTAIADASGAFSATVTLPADLAAGRHHLVAAGVDASGDPYYLVQQVSVAGRPVAGLALTGFEPLPWLAGGAAFLVAGSVLLLLGRRREA